MRSGLGGSSEEVGSLVGGPNRIVVDVGPAAAALVESFDGGVPVDLVLDGQRDNPGVLGNILVAVARIDPQKRAALVRNFSRAIPKLDNLRVKAVRIDEDPFKGSHEAFLFKVKRIFVWIEESLVCTKEDMFPDSLIMLFP